MLPTAEEITAAQSGVDTFANMPLETTEAEIAAMFGAEDHSAQIVALAKVYVAARKRKEAADAEAKRRGEEERTAEGELHRAMSSAGVPSIDIDDGGKTVKLSKSTRSVYQLPAGWKDDPAFCAWLRETAPDLVKHTVNASSFSAHCRELVEKAAAEGGAGAAVVNPLHPRVQCVEIRGVQVRGS